MPKFFCPNPDCHSKLTSPDSLAGQRTSCPKCKQPMILPDPAGPSRGHIFFPCAYCGGLNSEKAEEVREIVQCRHHRVVGQFDSPGPAIEGFGTSNGTTPHRLCKERLSVPRYFSNEIPYPDPRQSDEVVLARKRVEDKEWEKKRLWLVHATVYGGGLCSDEALPYFKLLDFHLTWSTPFDRDPVRSDEIKNWFLTLPIPQPEHYVWPIMGRELDDSQLANCPRCSKTGGPWHESSWTRKETVDSVDVDRHYDSMGGFVGHTLRPMRKEAGVEHVTLWMICPFCKQEWVITGENQATLGAANDLGFDGA